MLSRILSQYVRVWVKRDLYLFKQNIPWDIQQEAEEARDIFLSTHRFERHITRKDIPKMLIDRGLLSKDYKDKITKIDQQIKFTLIALYKNFDQVFEVDKNRKRLNSLRNSMDKYNSMIRKYDVHTIEYLGNMVYEDYVFKSSVYYNGKLISDHLISNFKSSYRKLCPGIKDLKQCARDDNWRTMWLTKGGDVFEILPLTEFQNMLAAFSKMYENVYQHPDCPSNNIIEDDDALDGWFLFQNEEKNKDGNKYNAGSSTSESFIFTDDPDERNAIQASNSPEAKAIQRMRERELAKNKLMKHKDFTDVKGKMLNASAGQSNR